MTPIAATTHSTASEGTRSERRPNDARGWRSSSRERDSSSRSRTDMKRCSFCKFETGDERAFSQHMTDVHGWGTSPTQSPKPAPARRPERKRVEYGNRSQLEQERDSMASTGWSPESEAEMGVSGKVEVEWVRGVPN